jgi:hypothetical protein
MIRGHVRAMELKNCSELIFLKAYQGKGYGKIYEGEWGLVDEAMVPLFARLTVSMPTLITVTSVSKFTLTACGGHIARRCSPTVLEIPKPSQDTTVYPLSALPKVPFSTAVQVY